MKTLPTKGKDLCCDNVKELKHKDTYLVCSICLFPYQELMTEIKSRQRDIDQFSDESQTLSQLTGESRVTSSISQLTSRYQALQQAVKVRDGLYRSLTIA